MPEASAGLERRVSRQVLGIAALFPLAGFSSKTVLENSFKLSLSWCLFSRRSVRIESCCRILVLIELLFFLVVYFHPPDDLLSPLQFPLTKMLNKRIVKFEIIYFLTNFSVNICSFCSKESAQVEQVQQANNISRPKWILEKRAISRNFCFANQRLPFYRKPAGW